MKRLFVNVSAVIVSAFLTATANAQNNEAKESTQSKNAQTTEAGKSTASRTKSDQVPAVVIMHYAVATETGCWATFYDEENFKGTSLTLTGRTAMPDVDFDLKPYRLGGSPDSLIVGPEASLELYGDEEFKDTDHVFLANERIDDLSLKPFWDDIESVRLKCTDTKAK